MKKISEATKGKAMVVGSIPSLVLTLAGMLCLVVDSATGIKAAWLTPPFLGLGLTWLVVGFSVCVVLDYWPQEKGK